MFIPRIKRGRNKNRFCKSACKDSWWNTKKRNPSGSKISRVLAILTSGKSLNRFEAEKVARDCVLNSTVSEIENRLGIPVDRQWEVVVFRGKSVRVRRYHLEDVAIECALRYLEKSQRHE